MAATYPTPGQLSNNVQLYKCVVTMAAATPATYTLGTLPTSGRFIVTKVIIHDPSANVNTTTLSFGSSATSTTSVSPAVLLASLAAAGATYIALDPGQISSLATGAVSGGTPPAGVATVLNPGDTLTCTSAGTVQAATLMVDVIGYTE